jgi:hypothetical protein
MTRWGALVLVLCLTALACDEDPANKIKIVARPPLSSRIINATPEPTELTPNTEASRPGETVSRAQAASGLAARPTGAGLASRTAQWRPVGCPPPHENSPGPSSLTVSGPCTFEHRAAVSCESMHDDFILTASREAARGATLMVYINVEKYKGPGSYENAEMFVGVQDETSIYRWSSDRVSITIGPDEAFAILPATRLDAEPLLVDCTGPQTNYQCGGRSDTSPINGTTEVVAGTLRCNSVAKSK